VLPRLAARRAAGPLKVLLYTRTAGPRHANLGNGAGAGLNPPLADDNLVQKGMLKLAADNGFTLDYTEDVTQMQRLVGYNAVIFFSTSRDNLDDGAKTALRQYMRAGGGFVGIHNAFGTLYNWPYYEGLLGGANFYDHGPEQVADVVIVDDKDARPRTCPSASKLQGRVVQPRAVPDQGAVPGHGRREVLHGQAGAGRGPAAASVPAMPPRPPMAPSVVGKQSRPRRPSTRWPGASTTTAARPG
jgi:hypothetical protein